MKLVVEFLGLSRRLAQVRHSSLELDEHATFRDALERIARSFPALVGPVIVPQTFDLVPSQILLVDGRHAVTDLDSCPRDGQRLILMFAEAGG